MIDEILSDARVSLIRLALIHFWLVFGVVPGWTLSFLVHRNKKKKNEGNNFIL